MMYRNASAARAPHTDPAPSGAHLDRRHLLRRGLAFVVDVGLLVGLILAVATVLSATLGPAVRFIPDGGTVESQLIFDARLGRVTAVAGIVTGCAYFCASWRLLGATPGQWLLGLGVRARHDGENPTIGRAVMRWVALGSPLWIASSTAPGWVGVTAALGMCAWIVCLLVAAARSASGRGLHDRISGTHVVRVERAFILPFRMARDVR